MIADAFIYPVNKSIGTQIPSVILDVDKQMADFIQLHLQKYKLRSKIDVAKTDHRIIQAWGPSTEQLWGQSVSPMSSKLPLGSFVAKQGLIDGLVDIGCKDPRHPLLGIRFVVEDSRLNNRKELYFNC